MNKENHAIIITSIISGVVLLVAIMAIFAFRAPTSSDTVTVQGISSIKAMPDLVTVYFNVETEGKTSAEAKEANDVISDKLSDALIAEGFDKTDIKTESFSVYPKVNWDNGKQTQDGYTAYLSVKLELAVEDMDKLTSVVDAGANAGAGIGYINFELTQEAQNRYKAEALKLASEDAQVKADSVAAGFNKKAGKLVSVSVSDFGYNPWNVYSASGGVSAKAEDAAIARETVLNMQPSEQEVTASVSATFKIQ